MKPRMPHWDLAQVQALVGEQKFAVLKSRALDFFSTPREGRSAVAEAVASLTLKAFSHTVQQRDVCDVYGVTVDGHGWYLKLCIDEATKVLIISFHPAERPIQTKGGWVQP